MHTHEASAIVSEALRLRNIYPQASALEILDLAMTGHTAEELPTTALAAPSAPGSAFGQLVAAAFDKSMSPAEWRVYTSASADPELAATMMQSWRIAVISRFNMHYSEPRRDGHRPRRAAPAERVNVGRGYEILV